MLSIPYRYRWPAEFLTILLLFCTAMPGDASNTPPAADSAAGLSGRLHAHVKMLAGSIGERNVFSNGSLERAAAYIRGQWEAQGHVVTAYPYTVHGQETLNLEITQRGNEYPDEIILVGAHYDSVTGSPGANDNASGVAAMLELSRLLASESLPCSVRFVAFVNEEPPFFQNENMGSRAYASMTRERGDRLQGMISLETIGYFNDAPHTQLYPPPLGLFYPHTGNFIGFVSNLDSRAWLHRAAGAFRRHSDFPMEQASLPGFMPGIDLSDHDSFWRHDYDAIMITDTALFRYPHYHKSSDTPDKVDYEALTRLTAGLYGMLVELASTPR